MEPRPEAVSSACSACQRSIPDTYFEAAGKIFCAACKDVTLAARTGGSGAGRLLKAGLLGTLAAAVSAAAWYAIVKLTGYELGIVAVVIGLVVGGAVRLGAEQRGGWAYQTLAVLLTYLAIAASYVPLVMASFSDKAIAAVTQSAGAGSEAGAEPPSETVLLVDAIAVSLVIPVLQVMEGGLIGLLIIAFALYEAWKINKRQTLTFAGPFRLQPSAGSSPL
jgi:hypothetical protein